MTRKILFFLGLAVIVPMFSLLVMQNIQRAEVRQYAHVNEFTKRHPHPSLFGNPNPLSCESDIKITGVIRTQGSNSYLIKYQPQGVTEFYTNTHFMLKHKPVIQANNTQIIVNNNGVWEKYCYRARQDNHEKEEVPHTYHNELLATPYLTFEATMSDTNKVWAYRITECRKYCSFIHKAGLSMSDRLLAVNGKNMEPEELRSLFSGRKKMPLSLKNVTVERLGQVKVLTLPEPLTTMISRIHDEK